MIDLSINVNKIALIRNSRPGDNPNLVNWIKKCVAYGADGITVHPRPDQRHIRADDCFAISASQLNVEFNIEGNPFAGPMPSTLSDVSDYPGFMAIVEAVRPDQCTLVPDSTGQRTSDHGFDLTGDTKALETIISRLHHAGSRVSLFMDPDCKQIPIAKDIGADRIEFYTGPYADAENPQSSFDHYRKAAELAQTIGLGINAGHDLNLQNIGLFSQLPGLQEVSIGHALTMESMELGLKETIDRYLKILHQPNK